MRARAWLPVAFLLVVPAAAAGYEEGSGLTADAPVLVEGRADTLLPNGIASFVASSPSAPVLVALTADTAQVVVHTAERPCFGVPGLPPSGCNPEPVDAHLDTYVLEDVTITVVRALSAYKLIATTDRTYVGDWSGAENGGELLVTSASTTQLLTNAEALHVSGMDDDWSAGGDAAFLPVYQADAGSAQFSGTAVVTATGGFEAFLQGLQVTVTGTQEDGSSFRETFDTRMPAGSEDPYRFLVVETDGGEMRASSAGAFVGFAPADQRPITDVHARARFTAATGMIVRDGDSTEVSDESVALEGPLSLRLTRIADGRLTYAITDGLQLAGRAEEPSDSPIPAGALAAAGAAGAGGAGGLIALAYFWPRFKYALTLAALPMYTRIERGAVLEHEKRDELYELIRSTPGIHAHEIGEKANIGWGTTVYHLKLLESHGLIVSKKSGRYKRFFVNTGEYTKKKDVYGALRNETAKAVAEYVVRHPGTTQKEMCAALGIQPSLASWHVEKLEGVELVKRVKDGRMVRYFAGPAWADLNVSVTPPVGAGQTPAET